MIRKNPCHDIMTPASEGGGMCQPNGLMFDAFGEPRTRYVRVTLNRSHCVMYPSEGDCYVQDARDAGVCLPQVVVRNLAPGGQSARTGQLHGLLRVEGDVVRDHALAARTEVVDLA